MNQEPLPRDAHGDRIRTLHRLRAPWILMSLLATASTPAITVAQVETQAKASPVKADFTPDSTLARVSGQYTISDDPFHIVWIKVQPSGLTRVLVLGTWESAGLFDGQEYRGVLRELQTRSAKGSLPETKPGAANGTLRFTLKADGRIAAELDFGSGPRRRETWSPVRQTEPEIPPFMSADPELPPPGETVVVDVLPEAIERVAPYYPEEARKRGIDGTVLVQALIGQDGIVKDLRIVKSIPELDRVAAACVWLWRFKPAMANSKAVAVWVAVPVRFSLH
jgi:TonB family protein